MVGLRPFLVEGGDALDRDFGPETKAVSIDFSAPIATPDGKSFKWERIETLDTRGLRWVDFNKHCADRGIRPDFVVGYFAAVVDSPVDQPGRLMCGSDDGIKIWLNGAVVHRQDVTRALSFPEDSAPISLRKGPNFILTKLRQGDGGSGLAVAIKAEKPVTFTLNTESPTTGNAPATGQGFGTKDGQNLPPIPELAQLKGDSHNGEAVFNNTKGANCVACHQVNNYGRMVGPPLTTVGQKLSKAQLYEAILHPNNAILMSFECWVVKTKKGKVYSGLKMTDTPAKLTIKDTEGKYHDIPQDQIARKVMQKVSLMPEGLAGTMTQQELVDLVEFLSTLRNK